MEIGYLIKNNEGEILAFNLSESFISKVSMPKNRVEITKCPISKKDIRHGLFEYPIASIYLVSYNKDITNKIFKRYFETCLFFIEHLGESEKEFKQKESQNFRRLRHNLITHNTNILQELENTFYTAGTLKGAHNQIKFVKEALSKQPDQVALSILKIIKSANLMRTDFDVYDMLSSENPYIEFDKHQIHKVLISVLRPFWVDLLEKGIIINIQDCNEFVNIDYKSISVVFTHLFDNLVKYISPNSHLNISFANESFSVIVMLEMTSMKIFKAEKEKIFEENFSGENARKSDKAGDGIGMYMVKRLVELNKGSVRIEVNVNNAKATETNGIPYERNRISIILENS